MEQWDIVCKRCGKHLFTEQRESTAGNIHRLNETNDEYYRRAGKPRPTSVVRRS